MSRKHLAAVVRLGVGACYHSRAAWGWDGEPGYAFRLVVQRGGFCWCQWRSWVVQAGQGW